MTKNLPEPILLAKEALRNLTDHPEYTELKKKLPAFAMQYATKNELTLDILMEIAQSGASALQAKPKKTAASQKTYHDILENLPKDEEKIPEQKKNPAEMLRDQFAPLLSPYIDDFIQSWKTSDPTKMQVSLAKLQQGIEPYNNKLREAEGYYPYYDFTVQSLFSTSTVDDASISGQLESYIASGDLSQLKLFHNLLPDLRISDIAVSTAAYHTQTDVLDYYLNDLNFDFPQHLDDHYCDDYISTKLLEDKNLESFKYLIENGHSQANHISSEAAVKDPAFFDFGFDYMHTTDQPDKNYLNSVISHGTFDQVVKVIEAGRYLANGTISDQDEHVKSHSNPISLALCKANDISLFEYLREQSPTDLEPDEVQHCAYTLLSNGHYDLIDLLYETYPEAFTPKFLNEEFRDAGRNFLSKIARDEKIDITPAPSTYLIKEFGHIISKDVVDEVLTTYFFYHSEQDLLAEALPHYPHDTEDLWQNITQKVQHQPKAQHFTKLQTYDAPPISDDIWLKMRETMSSHDLGNLDINAIAQIMDHPTMPASAYEWQDKIQSLCALHKPILDDILSHLQTHPLKDSVFTPGFAKRLVTASHEGTMLSSFSASQCIVSQCQTEITIDDINEHAEIAIEHATGLDFIAKNERYDQWQKHHAGAPHSLVDFSPFLHQPKIFAALTEIFEEEGQSKTAAEQYAYQTAATFGTMPRVLQYLEKWGTAGTQPLHDVVHSLKTPQEGRFDKSAWGDAIIKHGPKMAELLRFANRLPQPEKASDGKTWSYHKTNERISEFVYENSHHAPELAKLCHKLSMDEDSFEEARSIVADFNERSKRQETKPNQNIPNIYIDGKEFGKEGYKFERMETGDLRGLFLGAMTGCCQWIGGMGSDSAEHGFKSANGGFYAVSNPDGQIVSQAWAWRGRKGEIVLDSIETLGDHVTSADWKSICTKMGEEFSEKHKEISALHIGTGGQTPNLGFAHTENATAIDKLGYSDAEIQVMAWKRPKLET